MDFNLRSVQDLIQVHTNTSRDGVVTPGVSTAATQSRERRRVIFCDARPLPFAGGNQALVLRLKGPLPEKGTAFAV